MSCCLLIIKHDQEEKERSYPGRRKGKMEAVVSFWNVVGSVQGDMMNVVHSADRVSVLEDLRNRRLRQFRLRLRPLQLSMSESEEDLL